MGSYESDLFALVGFDQQGAHITRFQAVEIGSGIHGVCDSSLSGHEAILEGIPFDVGNVER